MLRALWNSSVLLVLASLSTSACSQMYGTRQDIATGFTSMEGLVVADFNGDGKPDLAATDGYGKTIVVYLNNGNGGFSTPVVTTLQINNTVGQLLAADFNEDGKQDLVVSTIASSEQDDIFLSGNGDGSFTQKQVLPGSFGFLSGSTVDINHDGHLDLILGGNGSMYLYLGDGQGNFTAQPFPNQVGGSFTDVATGDVNNDSNIDFITAAPDSSPNAHGKLYYYAGAGDGTFADPVNLSSSYLQDPTFVTLADFNGDGKLDLLASYSVAAVIPGKGDGTFDYAAGTTVGTTPLYPSSSTVPIVAAADMNGDGFPDVVSADPYTNTINVWLNDGTGTFPQSGLAFNAAIPAGTNFVRLADLNGDGIPDIILGNYITNNISVFLSISTRVLPAVSLSSSASNQLVGTTLKFTAKVDTTGSTVPTGSVSLLEGTTNLATATLDTTGSAVFSLSTLTAGSHSLSVSYAGDANYLHSVSSPLTQLVSDFQISLASPTQTISAGDNATYNLMFTPVGGFSGSISLSCSGLPAASICLVSPVTVNGQTTTSLIVATTAPQSHSSINKIGSATLGFAGFSLATFMLACFFGRRRRFAHLLVVCLLAAGFGLTMGCGGGTSIYTVSPGTPAGTTTFTITATITSGSQTVTHQTSATLTVN